MRDRTLIRDALERAATTRREAADELAGWIRIAREEGMPVAEIAAVAGTSRSQIYAVLKRTRSVPR